LSNIVFVELFRKQYVNKKHLVKEKAPEIRGFFVGVARFELTTSSSQTRRDTGLRYTPNFLLKAQEYPFSKMRVQI
jgi:hypothetical protein